MIIWILLNFPVLVRFFHNKLTILSHWFSKFRHKDRNKDKKNQVKIFCVLKMLFKRMSKKWYIICKFLVLEWNYLYIPRKRRNLLPLPSNSLLKITLICEIRRCQQNNETNLRSDQQIIFQPELDLDSVRFGCI